MLIVILTIHECGHAVAVKAFGLRLEGIRFLPFFGAMTQHEMPKDRYKHSMICLAGPITGVVLASGSMVAYKETRAVNFAVFAVLSSGLNLFNLVPAWVLDGGRIFTQIRLSVGNGLNTALTFTRAAVCIWVAVVYGYSFYFILPFALLFLHKDIKKSVKTRSAMRKTPIWTYLEDEDVLQPPMSSSKIVLTSLLSAACTLILALLLVWGLSVNDVHNSLKGTIFR